ncbi:MAG: YtxH domain-containing protein [Armatimonadota bacterium]|nr:YtxH domain-containing protein [Armatimonadota bacterium]
MASERQSFMLGILLGGIAGAAAALLYAPQEGKQTREQIKGKALEAKERASEAVSSAKESAEKAGAKGREYVEIKTAQVREAVQAGRKAAAEKKAELQAESKEAEHKPSI